MKSSTSIISIIILAVAMSLQVGCMSNSGRLRIGPVSYMVDEKLINYQLIRAQRQMAVNNVSPDDKAAICEAFVLRSGSERDVVLGFRFDLLKIKDWFATTLGEKALYTGASVLDAVIYYEFYQTGDHYIWGSDSSPDKPAPLPYANNNDVISAVNADGTQTISIDVQDGAATPSNIYAVNGSGTQTIIINRKPPEEEK